MTDIRELLDGIEKRAKAATPGLWQVHNDNEGTDYFPLWVVANDEFYNPTGGEDDEWPAIHMYVETGRKEDAEFIAHARAYVPSLVAALRAVLDLHEASLDSYPSVCAECVEYMPCPTVRAITEALGGGA